MKNTVSTARTPTPPPIPALAPVESPPEEAERIGGNPPTAAVLEAEVEVNVGVVVSVVAILVNVDWEELVVCGEVTDIETPSSAHVPTT